ncbi:MAG: hypothetical protein G8345_20725 [Magnetococcales bacterium]|nr:hypothetical protein [Magnetococcales bacterium]NGZ29296.1 hypothetical protein [Magnetococcales bacterium]
MDYTELFRHLQEASLFDLYRLKVGISLMLDQPERLDAIKYRLQPGMAITFFNGRENRSMEGVVEAVQRTNVDVYCPESKTRWTVPIYAVNLDGVDTQIHTRPGEQRLQKNQLRVGEQVGFRDRAGKEVYGKILQLNQKTATIQSHGGGKWRVPFSMLFKVMDGHGAPYAADVIQGELLLE